MENMLKPCFCIFALVLLASARASPLETSGAEILESNDLGELVIGYVHQFLDTMEDPLLVVDNITISLFLNDTIHISGDVNATDVYLTGFKNINFTDCIVELALPLVHAIIGVRLPEVTVYGNYAMELLETSIFPIPLEGEGPFSLRISEIQFDAEINLDALPDGAHFEIKRLSYEVEVYSIWGRIDGLFTGVDEGQLNEAVNKLFNSYATILFNLFEAQYHEDVIDLVTLIGNQFLANWPPEALKVKLA